MLRNTTAPILRTSVVHVDPYLTMKEVGVLLRRTPRTIRRHVQSGNFPAGTYLFNGRIPMWKRSVVLRWLREQERSSRPPRSRAKAAT